MTVIIVSIALVVIMLAAYAYFGGFSSLEIRTGNTGGETIVYKEVTGDYKQTPAVTDEVYHYLLNELKIETYKGVGIFYDNPKKNKKNGGTSAAASYTLRSEVGCIIEPEDTVRLSSLPCKYKIKTLPVHKAFITEFPYKGGLSVVVALFKVYPALEKYAKTHRLTDTPLIEIYDMPNKKIIYRRPVDSTVSFTQGNR